MPRGFIGRPAAQYLGQVSDAHTTARNASTYRPEGAPMGPRERRLPFNPEDAHSGGAFFSQGSLTTIAVDASEYDMVANMVSHADDVIGECLYNVAAEIEVMCQTTFILPKAVPRCVNVSDNIKSSLGQFRSLTEESLIQLRRFTQEILNIG